MHRVLVVCSLLGIALLGPACASADRLTVAEYADLCADGIASARNLIEPESVTWGDLIRLGEPSLERLRSVEPPEALAEFHSASIRTLDFVIGVAEEQPAEETANPLAFGLSAVRIATQLSRAIDGLEPTTRATLRRAGCL
ncbi:MAG: hypothetical protein OXI41_10545 [Chloroflexota bacterium]|nr:hypothetical protein [Chloroflexota bacterium]MDE2893961.1 hypothetical protein [Chloroflexota bacterium]